MEKLKTNSLLKVIDDIIIKYSNTTDFIQQQLNEKCDTEGISRDKANFFLISLEGNQVCYISKSTYAISRFKSVICLIKILKGAQLMYI